jgi:hypothetical protein
MVWNFALHVYELNTKHTIEDMDVLTYLIFPMIWWWPIFSLSLSFYATHCLGLSPMMSHQCAIYVVFTASGDGLSHPSQNFTSFCVVRHKGWFENKVFSKYDRCLQLFNTRVVCPPCTPLRFIVTPFLNLHTNKLV